ncbi:cytochrome P450 [Streptomyces phaeochromogenes]|uniref:Cytochrome P450 n=1 Tax=Streptomyces phaeochromogenes TaxID=1923 RepID=A0ABZ1H9Z7_STRPH|nr:cytochrome P450 [Streptomyces phaeochromogenes]WSD14381.1 cytochrome P450 [Streptomyces phaeochromogenes]
MSTTTRRADPVDHTELPPFPGVRSARCPFDPPTDYAAWREGEGLRRALWRGEPMWVVSRFADIREALGDPRLSADDRTPGFPVPAPAGSEVAQSFVRMDDPEHIRLRRMLTGEFTVKRMERLRPLIQEQVDHFLEQMISQRSPADLVSAYAFPIPSMVISLMLGVPYEDHEHFQEHSATIVRSDATEEEKQAATMALAGYMYELAARKQHEPADDLISRQLQRVAAGEISHDTVVVNGMALLVAGHETTANMIALSTLALLEQPDELARIRDTDDPAVVANAVEELLRYLTIVQDGIFRVATEDVTVGGQLVRAGEALLMNLPAGNRDATFSATPDTFDADRTTRGHLAFGYGTHQCLGQPLARVELQIALPALLRRLPDLRLAMPLDQIAFRNNTITYGPHVLPVAW